MRQKCLHPATELHDVTGQKTVIERHQISLHFAGILNYTFSEQTQLHSVYVIILPLYNTQTRAVCKCKETSGSKLTDLFIAKSHAHYCGLVQGQTMETKQYVEFLTA